MLAVRQLHGILAVSFSGLGNKSTLSKEGQKLPRHIVGYCLIRDNINIEPGFCRVEDALDIIVRKWKPLILVQLLENGTMRFSELKRSIPGITQKMLTK